MLGFLVVSLFLYGLVIISSPIIMFGVWLWQYFRHKSGNNKE